MLKGRLVGEGDVEKSVVASMSIRDEVEGSYKISELTTTLGISVIWAESLAEVGESDSKVEIVAIDCTAVENPSSTADVVAST